MDELAELFDTLGICFSSLTLEFENTEPFYQTYRNLSEEVN